MDSLLDLFPSVTENETYLSGLPSLALSDLLTAPTTLSTQSHTLTASLNALAHTSYPTILSLHNTSSALLTSLASLDTSLNALLDTALPALDHVTRTFRDKSGPTVIEERQRTRLVLEQYDKLRDLLDIPVLMDTCVRNGLYAEALALAAHATQALSKLSAPLPLASALQAEIASSLQAMRILLLGTLHEPARKLPAFWKAVQFLRKMEVMPESELALAFVSARIGCLANALQAVERDAGVSVLALTDDEDHITGTTTEREKEMDRRAEDVARFLKKYIDVWRESAYDLVTQYTTIFLDRSSPHASHPLPDPVIKHTLPSTLLDLLLPTVKTYLWRAYPHLAPLATQLAYCSSAMARIGMDFRALLSPIITHAVVDGFTRDIKTSAEREWTSTLAKHASPPTPPNKWLVSASSPLPAFSALTIPPSSAVHAPPQVLTAFTPLAVLLNTYLRALNRLRGLVPVGALSGVLDALETSLASGGEALWTHVQAWEEEEHEHQVVRAVRAAYVRVFVPFLRRAVIEGVFGAADASSREVGAGLSEQVRKWEASLGPETSS